MIKVCVFSNIAVFFVAFSIIQVDSAKFLSPKDKNLEQTLGGACQDCFATLGGCSGSSCVANKTVWTKSTGTNLTPNKCGNVGPGEPGLLDCTDSTPKDCFLTRTCTDMNCVNCGAQGSTKKNSVCTVTGTYCEVPVGG